MFQVFSYTPPDLSSYSTFDGDYANLTNTPTLFNGDYFSLTNRPTIPSALADLANVSSTAPTAGQVLKWDGSEWAPAADSTGGGGSGIALTDLSVGAEDPASGDGGISYDNTTGVFKYAPPDLSGYQPTSNVNADIDAHLNQSGPTDGYVLSWTSGDYAWVSNAGGGGIALTDLSVGAEGTASGDGAIAYNDTTGVFTYTPPDLSDYATVSGNLASLQSSIASTYQPIGSYLTAETNDLTAAVTWANIPDANVPESAVTQHTAALTITESQISDFGTYLTSYTETDTLDDVIGRGATTTTTAVIPFLYANQAAFPNASTYHGAIAHSHSDGAMYFAHGGNWNRLANYTDLSPYQTVGTLGTNIDLHLNQGNPTAGYVLSWNGSDYAWVSNSTLSNIQDETYGVSVTGKMAIGTIDIGSGINASPGATFDLQGTTINFGSATIMGGNAFDDVIDTHLWSGSTQPTNGYVLSWDSTANSGNGDYAWVSNSGGLTNTDSLAEGSTNLYYTDARFDARLQTRNFGNLADVDTSGASNGQVLAWSSANSQWEPLTISSGIALTDLSVTTASAGTAALSYDNTSGVFTYTPPDLSSYLTSVPAQSFASLTGKPTTLAGYGITDAVGSGSTLDTNTIQTSSGNLTISADNYVRIDSDNNGQIEIGTNSGVGDVRIGNEGNGTSIHMEGVTTFEQDVKFETGVEEKFQTLTGQSGVVNHNCNDGHIFYHTTPAGDITANITNLGLTQEYASNITIIVNQGATARIVSAVQIGGSAQTINWQGGSAPTGTSNGIDSFSFTILNDGGSYVVLGQMVDFA